MVLWARRKFHLSITPVILQEYSEIAHRLGRKLRDINPEPWLEWIERKAKVYESAPLGKQRSRDPDDDPLLACALASGAEVIVSKDEDMLALEKPFGIQITTPRQFLARFR